MNITPTGDEDRFYQSLGDISKEGEKGKTEIEESKMEETIEFKKQWVIWKIIEMGFKFTEGELAFGKLSKEQFQEKEILLQAVIDNILQYHAQVQAEEAREREGLFKKPLFLSKSRSSIRKSLEKSMRASSTLYNIQAGMQENEKDHFGLRTSVPLSQKAGHMYINMAEEKTPIAPQEKPEKKKELPVCSICFMDCDEQNPEWKIQGAKKCNHSFCLSCIKGYLENEILSSKVKGIACPLNGCGSMLPDEEIQKIVSPELFQKMEKFRENDALMKDPNVRWCIKPGCETPIKRGNDKSRKLTCPKCGTEICFKCKNAWHGNVSCENVVDEGYREYERNTVIKLCPECKAKIEKNEGCNHMTCQRCGYQFCWICCRKYSDNHFSAWNILGCPGMQFGYEGCAKCCGKCQCFCKFLLLFLYILGIPILCAVPALFIAACALASPFYLFYYWKDQSCLEYDDCCDSFGTFMLNVVGFVASMVLCPLSFLYLFFQGIKYLICEVFPDLCC